MDIRTNNILGTRQKGTFRLMLWILNYTYAKPARPPVPSIRCRMAIKDTIGPCRRLSASNHAQNVTDDRPFLSRRLGQLGHAGTYSPRGLYDPTCVSCRRALSTVDKPLRTQDSPDVFLRLYKRARDSSPKRPINFHSSFHPIKYQRWDALCASVLLDFSFPATLILQPLEGRMGDDGR